MLVGREREFECLRALIKNVIAGRGGVVILEGDPGLGKTHLIEEIVEYASEAGIRVLAASAEELDRRRPFGPIVDCLGIDSKSPDERRASIARLLLADDTRRPGLNLFELGAGTEFRVSEALLELIEEVCARTPVLIAIDDLQWPTRLPLPCCTASRAKSNNFLSASSGLADLSHAPMTSSSCCWVSTQVVA